MGAGNASEEHVRVIRTGRAAVTRWRAAHPSGRLQLRTADLRGADLRGVDLRQADLRDADLEGASLESADLFRADLAGASFRAALLDGADLRESGMSATVFADARMAGANLTGATANSGEADWRGVRLRAARLAGIDLRHVDLRGADLDGADLERADLSSADLRGASLRRVSVGWGSFFGQSPGEWRRSAPTARFDDADLGDAVFDDSDLVAASFTGARLAGASLRGANLVGASMFGIAAAGATLSGCDLTGADLTGARALGVGLEHAVLLGACLQHADLRSAHLAGAWLGATNLIDASLEGAVGLERVRHAGPTWLDRRAIERGLDDHREFLAGCAGRGEPAPAGSDRPRTGSIPSWLVAVDSAEEPFGVRLISELRNAGVECWSVPSELLTERRSLRSGHLLCGVDGVVHAGTLDRAESLRTWSAAALAATGTGAPRVVCAWTDEAAPPAAYGAEFVDFSGRGEIPAYRAAVEQLLVRIAGDGRTSCGVSS